LICPYKISCKKLYHQNGNNCTEASKRLSVT
jgi:hypothetical protein